MSPANGRQTRVIYKPSLGARQSLAALDDYLPTLLNFRKPLETAIKLRKGVRDEICPPARTGNQCACASARGFYRAIQALCIADSRWTHRDRRADPHRVVSRRLIIRAQERS